MLGVNLFSTDLGTNRFSTDLGTNRFSSEPFDVDQLRVADLQFMKYIQACKPILPKPEDLKPRKPPHQDLLELVQSRILSATSQREAHWYRTYFKLFQSYLSKYPRSKSQHSWICRQRDNRHLGKLTQEKIDLLERLPGWTWEVLIKTTKKKWVEKLIQLREFLIEHNHWPAKSHPLYRWAQVQFQRWSLLNPDQKERLKSLEQIYTKT